MESKEFEGFEILEKENIDQEVARIKVDQEYQQREQKLLEDAGKTKNDLGKGEKKKGGGLFSSITSVFDRGKKKDKKQKKDDIYNIGVELEELDGGLLEEDEVGDELNNVLKNYKEEDDDDKAEKNMGEAEDNDSEKNTGDEIEEVGVGLDDILKNFKTGDNKAENDQQNIGNELEALHDELDEDEEGEGEEEEEPDEYVYDSKLHWGTTNLLHSFLYHKGEKYRFSEHGTVRNWFHKKLFGSHRSQEKSRRALEKAKKDHIKSEEESGRFYGDDATYKRWEHNGARNWFHDKWHHMKNAHRKAVDRFYNYEKDYRRMSWLNRVIWCVKNPLARIMVNFSRTHFGTEARQNLLGRMRKLYRQAISEGFIPASKLGDLDYDPFTGREGQMGRATEAKQLEFNAEHKKDMLDGGRSLVRLKLLQIHSQKDVLVMRCMSEGVDPDAAVLEFMKNKTVQNSCVTCLNAIRQADWEIAKASAQKEGKPLPDEADNPANHPIEIGEGDEEALRLSGLINAQLGIPNEPLKKTKFWKETEKEVTEKQEVLDTDSYISLIRTANELPNAISTTATKGIAGSIFVGTDVLNLRRYYLKLKEAKAKGDMMECERIGHELARSVNDIYNRAVTFYRFSRDMLGTTAGSGYAAPGAAISGILDASMGYHEMKHFGKVVDDIEKLKKKEKDPGSRKSKILNMAGDTASADKSGGVGRMVTGFINTIGGALNTTGILGSFGLLFTAAGIISGAVTNSVVSSKKYEIGVRNVNTEMGLVERQRLLWDYFLKQGGQPSEYSRGITKRAILMEEGFTKGTRKQGVMQQQINYAQKIADNLNSGNPDPTYVKMMESLKIKKGEDNLYHMEVIANAIGSKHDNLIKNYIDSTTDNEFIDMAEKVKRRNAVLRDTLNKSMNKGKKRSEWIDTDKFIRVTADKMAEEKAEEKRKQKEAAKQAEEERKRRSEEHLRILREKRNKDKKENGGNAG